MHELVVVNNASHGKQMQNVRAIRVVQTIIASLRLIQSLEVILRGSRGNWHIAEKEAAAGGVQTTTETKATAGTHPSADKPMTPALTRTAWLSS